MKKLMIAAAIVCAAAMSQAASVDWQINTTPAEIGYNVYVILGDSAKTDWSDATAVLSASVDNGQIATAGRGAAAKGTATDDSITKSSSFYYVMVKADNSQFAVSSVYQGSNWVYDTTAEPPESTKGWATWNATSGVTYHDFTAVPEPTSAMLLLLGVAGLALRRKQK